MPDYKSTDVDSKQVDSTAKGIEAEIKELVSINAILASSILVNLEPYWQGPAMESFKTQFLAYKESFRKFVDEHEELNENLQAAGKNYGQADDSVRQLIGKMAK